MAPRLASQWTILKEQKKLRILDAALAQFSEKGFSGASIESIAREAGVAKGLLYTYFESKEDLLHELLRHGLGKVKDYMAAFPMESLETREQFAAGMKAMVELFRQEEDFWRLYCLLILQRKATGPFREEVAGFLKEFLGVFIRYFEKKKSPDPMAEAMLFGAVIDGLMFDLMMIPDYPSDAVIAMIVDKFA